MKTYKIIGTMLVAILTCLSCKKSFLDVQPGSVITQELSVRDLTSTNYFLNGIYINMAKDLYQFGSLTAYPEIIADNLKPATAASTIMAPQYSWNQRANTSAQDPIAESNANKLWLNGYGLIRACSFVIDKATVYRTENPAKSDNIRAQALALRAYVNLMLVNIFAQAYNYTADAGHPGIPVVTTSDWSKPLTGRATVSENYNGIISDLTTAIPLFETGTAQPFYMNKNAAKGILARVYLFKGDYTAAKNIAREVSNAVPIMPASATGYPSKLFTNKETEALFQLNPSESGVSLPSLTGNYSGNYTTTFLGRYFVSPKRFIATGDISSVLTQNATDLRKVWVTTAAGVVNVTKYPQTVIAGFSVPSNSYYQTLVRSSEMYLTAAEAYANLNREDSARYYVNQIRLRANIPALSTSISGTALTDSIYLERRRELCFEGLRMFDLQRWKKDVTRKDYWGTAQKLSYPANKAIAPLPVQDVEAYKLTQNLSY